jgi:hypothetical protein
MTKKRQAQTTTSPQTHRKIALGALVMGLILLLVAGGLVLFNARQPAQPPIDVSQIPDFHDEQGVPYPDIPRITVEEARAKFDAGEAIFVDVRSLEEYQVRHIPGAVSMPTEEIPQRYAELPKDAEIILYCT